LETELATFITETTAAGVTDADEANAAATNAQAGWLVTTPLVPARFYAASGVLSQVGDKVTLQYQASTHIWFGL
jgi:hypothetical protein